MAGSSEARILANLSGAWLESQYEAWKQDAGSVPRDWHIFFTAFELGQQDGAETPVPVSALKQSGVQSLIYRYRDMGHLMACTDPLSPCKTDHPQLSLSAFGLDESDLDTRFTTRRFWKTNIPLSELLTILRQTYCREIGVEFMHIQEPDERQWLIDRMEPSGNHPEVSRTDKLRVLEKLHQAALFEDFLHRRFVGQKRFSLEGGEILLPTLDALVRRCPELGITDLVLGMAHRGRLNVLAHIFGKPYEEIFGEFRDTLPLGFVGDGDVKYHRGYSSDVSVGQTRVHLILATNPSHLEAVNPVVEGKCRARQERYGAGGAKRVLPVLIHGDAAFSGQGCVMETLNMAQLEGYGCGGTIHVVINNQIGFTTTPRDARSTRYATDVAKMLACPIFHVQGEAPESALHVIRLALEYRQSFGRDVVVELISYRRYGHNEGDEPAFTQPLLYHRIGARPPANRLYAERLAGEGIAVDELVTLETSIRERLEAAFGRNPAPRAIGFKDNWSGISQNHSQVAVDTTLPEELLLDLGRGLAELPAGFSAHAKVAAILLRRLAALEKRSGIDWGNAETLVYASLLREGISVRLSGQDCRRGTFNHRHCVIHDTTTGGTVTPLVALAAGNATFQVWDSPLSEFGVLGFEYGYSLETPHGLTIWEAQFGDFANGAQVIIDQFISSGETKWNRASGLTLLLPHGYEGQGAEHSNARIERYLQLCANDNMQVANPTTPAQMFHLLRRQVLQSFRTPLIVFTPKSLLGHPRCVSRLADLAGGGFREIMVDAPAPGTTKRILFCSGKLFYELLAEREKRGADDTAIIRIEQLYPLRGDLVERALASLPQSAEKIWVQEEPQNMGAWPYLAHRLAERCGPLQYLGRPEHCCPATGSHHIHIQEQVAIVAEAFAS